MSAPIPKGGTNREGLTWEEWRAAAEVAAGPPRSGLEVARRSLAWRHGVDPTDWGKP